MPTAPTTKPTRRFRPARVVAVRPLTPRLIQVAFAGDALDGFEIAAPTQHVKLLFPSPGEDAPALPEFGPDGIRFPDGRVRPAMRTFTPRRFDAATATLEVEFVLHGEGPASTWARQAAPGQGIAVAGPGGRMPLALGPGRWIVAGDESAIPAIATLLEALPASASAEVYVEVDDASDEIAFESDAEVAATWLPRPPGHFGQTLAAAVSAVDVTGVAGVWIACEASAVRSIRRALLTERGVDPSSLVTRGYWRLGEQNHPDHDYGEDAA
jgi:NADPH-dependent ferric siderophore reductase